MKARLEDALEKLEPPPGGLDRLRARMVAAERPQAASSPRPLAWIATAAAAASVLVVAALATLERPAARRVPEAAAPPPAAVLAAAPATRLPGFHPALATLGLEPLPSEPVTVGAEAAGSVALRRVPVADERVVFYLVATVGP